VEKGDNRARPSGHGPERKAHTIAADSPLDTAALLVVIALIGL
jgi:hypothetical protein